MTGFAHHQVLALADKLWQRSRGAPFGNLWSWPAVTARAKRRSYYTDFAKALPQDTVILTAGCAKYKYNKLDLGDIGGIPRVLDAGQCQ